MSLSTDVKDLLKCILRRNPTQRFNINQILEHPAILSRIDEFLRPISEEHFVLMMTSYMQNCGMSTKRDHPEEIKKFKASNKAFEKEFLEKSNAHGYNSFFDDIVVQAPSHNYHGPILTPFFGTDPGFFDNIMPINFKKSRNEIRYSGNSESNSNKMNSGQLQNFNSNHKNNFSVENNHFDTISEKRDRNVHANSIGDSGYQGNVTREVNNVSSREIQGFHQNDLGQFSQREFKLFSAVNQPSQVLTFGSNKKLDVFFPDKIENYQDSPQKKNVIEASTPQFSKIVDPKPVISSNFVNAVQNQPVKNNPLMSESIFFNYDSKAQKTKSSTDSNQNLSILKPQSQQVSSNSNDVNFNGSHLKKNLNTSSNQNDILMKEPGNKLVDKQLHQTETQASVGSHRHNSLTAPSSFRFLNYDGPSTNIYEGNKEVPNYLDNIYLPKESKVQSKPEESVRYFPYEIQEGNKSIVFNKLNDEFNRTYISGENHETRKKEGSIISEKLPLKSPLNYEFKNVLKPNNDHQQFTFESLNKDARIQSNHIQFINHDQFHSHTANLLNTAQVNSNSSSIKSPQQQNIVDEKVFFKPNVQNTVLNSQVGNDLNQSKQTSSHPYGSYFDLHEISHNTIDLKRGVSHANLQNQGIEAEKSLPQKTVTVYKSFTRPISIGKTFNVQQELHKHSGHPYFIPHK